ncbi:hypothetical protein UFOVP1244_8 [uncultured Caudovirales phage]|uniref:Uncharacterized protein n=1 Tax=uncultured Caudovirales phage TaxID=2100421 RepID=A0A6J5RKE7_9CAUD|nr:hypothetical protein UFOVP1244_8 [uncultured Caudovirales phage]
MHVVDDLLILPVLSSIREGWSVLLTKLIAAICQPCCVIFSKRIHSEGNASVVLGTVGIGIFGSQNSSLGACGESDRYCADCRQLFDGHFEFLTCLWENPEHPLGTSGELFPSPLHTLVQTKTQPISLDKSPKIPYNLTIKKGPFISGTYRDHAKGDPASPIYQESHKDHLGSQPGVFDEIHSQTPGRIEDVVLTVLSICQAFRDKLSTSLTGRE